ncbi:MAG: 5-oxoprolinase [Bacteroidetes bacterium]|jgi:5-oxoprolinase (ATP-hydrolysing)|nr:5-oxoprolinase [Bacteroidota bacterium]
MQEQNQSSAASPWKLYIDTGGTFTDCIAYDPDGNIHRRKVLSSSAVRGTAEGGTSSTNVKVVLREDLPEGFFKECDFSLLDRPGETFRILNFNASASQILLDREIDLSGKESHAFEIVSGEEAPILAARMVTRTAPGDLFPPLELRLSTTKGTNALLERKGAKTLFIITEGFGDLIKIKNQQRPDIFSLNIQKSDPFYYKIIEARERVDANGNIIKPLDKKDLQDRIKPIKDEFDAVAICLMNSYKNSRHEQEIEKILLDMGFQYVSCSSDLSPEIKIVPRAVTADVNAYLTPIMDRYLSRIAKVISGSSFRVMSSGGNLVEADHYLPKDGLLSGPAGGVIGAAAIGKRVAKNLTGLEKIISFDMGGTSSDVSRYDGAMDYVYEHAVADATLAAPAVDIETVAAGGGSICGFDGRSLTVGPESAGADPGPACYGRGGPLTITDVNLLSGRLNRANFHISIDRKAADMRFKELQKKVNENRDQELSRNQILSGFLDIANERMAQAIETISTQKGFDPMEYSLVAFGGAGAQHATAIAEKLNISTVLVPADAGLLSAYGLQQATLEQIETLQMLKPLSDVERSLKEEFDKLERIAQNGLNGQGVDDAQITAGQKQLFLRFQGQDSSVAIDWSEGVDISERFEDLYRQSYGHWIEDREIEVEVLRVRVSEKKPDSQKYGDEKKQEKQINYQQDSNESTTFITSDGELEAAIYRRKDLKPGASLTGPALVLDAHSTTVLEPGWTGDLLDDGTWLFKHTTQGSEASTKVDRSEEVNLQLYTNRFTSVAEEMGEVLRKTSMSVNVKERLDFSCALLNRDGYLVVNAPHIPVHLGAMGTCVRTIIDWSKNEKTLQEIETLGGLSNEFVEGDIIVTNHPAFGGSHLPDVTVITPVFVDGERIGFVASRAHHAEIGGKRPGSMPPDATRLSEEGVVIPPTLLARNGDFRWDHIKQLLTDAEWPTRSIDENMADLQSAVSANHRGAEKLKSMASEFGVNDVTSYMRRLKAYAADRMRLTLNEFPNGEYSASETLDDGSVLAATCMVHDDSISIDFSGTSPVNDGNLNANPSIVTSVVIYVLRLMIDEPLPLNDGLLEPVDIILPECMLNPDFPDDPAECPAVVGGNIETSQRLTDTLLKAVGLSACSYGTMNNVLFGNDHFGYYETVGGGTGAGDGFHGADAVHQHMTNTRATDPEVLEHRYPVRLDRYAIRIKSGGNGKWQGGNGTVRELTFLEPVSLSVLTQHRENQPFGLNGGEPAKPGLQWIERAGGSRQELNWRDGADLEIGDRFILQTPGGGGFGKNEE